MTLLSTQGGCIETTKAEPTFVADGVVLNCVANLPGAVAGNSTAALPYAVQFANKGWGKSMQKKRKSNLVQRL